MTLEPSRETGRHAGRRSMCLFGGLLLAWAVLAVAPDALAQPELDRVVKGNAQVSTGATTTITQTSKKAIVDWCKFNLSNGEKAAFDQRAGSDSITLNRVVGSGGASSIDGAITAPGHVWLINPSGILFGTNAKINVHGLLATTTDIDNDRFMSMSSNSYAFDKPSSDPQARVVNLGQITVDDHGYAVLAGPHVGNEGSSARISGRLGSVVLAGVQKFTIDFDGDGLLKFTVNGSVADTLGQPLVENSGEIRMNGGVVQMTALAAGQVQREVINTSGIVEAQAIGTADGHVVLNGGGSGTLAIDGPVTATNVDVVGQRIEIASNLKASDDVRLTGRDVVTEGTGLIKAHRLDIASLAKPGQPGTVSIKAAVDELTVGRATSRAAPFAVAEVTNTGDLAVTKIDHQGIEAGRVDLRVDGEIRLEQPITATASGDAVVIVADRFVNAAGPAAVSTPAGRLLIYSDDARKDERGGIPAQLIQGKIGDVPPASIGNVFIYETGLTPDPPAPPPVTPVTPPPPAPPAAPAAVETPAPSVVAVVSEILGGSLVPVTQAVVVPPDDTGSPAIVAPAPPPGTLVDITPIPVDVAAQDMLFANDGNRELWGLSGVR